MTRQPVQCEVNQHVGKPRMLIVCMVQVSKLGVASILVDTSEGVSVRTLKQGLDLYNKQYKN